MSYAGVKELGTFASLHNMLNMPTYLRIRLCSVFVSLSTPLPLSSASTNYSSTLVYFFARYSALLLSVPECSCSIILCLSRPTSISSTPTWVAVAENLRTSSSSIGVMIPSRSSTGDYGSQSSRLALWALPEASYSMLWGSAASCG